MSNKRKFQPGDLIVATDCIDNPDVIYEVLAHEFCGEYRCRIISIHDEGLNYWMKVGNQVYRYSRHFSLYQSYNEDDIWE